MWVRLVKGAYWDYETVIAAQHGWPVPVFTQKWQTDANYERLTEFLLENVDWLVPAFGSHNIRSIAHALAMAERLGVPNRRFEIQMLYGMADPIKEAIQSLGYRVRVYTPYGQLLPWHGIPCPAAAGEHVERFVLAARIRGRAIRGGAACRTR